MSFLSAMKRNILSPILGRALPSKEWLESLSKGAEYTPDRARLSKWAAQLMFVYDNLQRGHAMHSALEDSALFLCNAFTVFPHTLVKKKLGPDTFPIALQKRSGLLPFYPVKGELYLIHPSSVLPVQDIRLENTVSFRRIRVHVNIPYSKLVWVKDKSSAEALGYDFLDSQKSVLRIPGQRQVVSAWMYVGIPEYWEPVLDGGYAFGKVQTFYPSKVGQNPYSFFTPQEYSPKKLE